MEIVKTGKKYANKAKSRIYKFLTLKVIFPRWYRWCAKKGVEEDKIVFIEIRYAEITNSFRVLYDKLQKEYSFKNKFCFLRNGLVTRREYFFRCLDMIREIATAKCVFMDDATNIVSACPIRKETSIVQLWHGCGAFKGFGFSTADLIFGDNREERIRYPYYKNYTFVSVSSPEVIWAYAEAMGLEDQKEVIKPLGVSRTDIFFNATYLEQARKNLIDLIPEAQGKKIILFAPTYRGRAANGQAPAAFNVEILGEALAGDYILLIKQHPLVKKLPSVPEKWQHFAFDVTKSMTIEDLMCVADICISDYSSMIFEYSLFEKPMIFFAYDLEEYFDWRGFYYPYDNTFIPGPIVTTNKEIVDYIQHPEKFNLQQVKEFKEKFMSSCDGNASERILQEALGECLEKYKKETVDEARLSLPQAGKAENKLLSGLEKQCFYNSFSVNGNISQDKAENKAVFVLQDKTELSIAAKAIEYKLREAGNFEITEIRLNQENTQEYIRDCKKALKVFISVKYIVTDEDITLFHWLPEEIQEKIIHCDLPYDFLLRNKQFEELKGQNTRIKVEEGYLKKALVDKKETLFAPYTHLDSTKDILLCVAGTDVIDKLDWQQFYENLAEEYNIFVFCPNYAEISIPEHLRNKVILLSPQWLLDDCILLADVLIGESDLRVLQGLREGKKVLFWGTQPDRLLLRIDDDWIRAYYKKTVCKTTTELINKISSDVEIGGENIKNIVENYFS